ncbi:MAG: hypothetical protein HUK08_00540 [Bacteroidaceae bacterium]|nr:hypothetical protein [Bacteroidaceae bacterium]
MLCTLTGCINEDLSDCGIDYKITYDVRLRTNLSTEIETELNLSEMAPIASLLKSELSTVFTDVAKDVDLSFYTNHLLTHHEEHEVNASSTSFQIYLPVDNYQHLALANWKSAPKVARTGESSDTNYKLSNEMNDTIDSHPIGLFSARFPIRVEDKAQSFHVVLTMINSSAIVVIDKNGCYPDDIFGNAKGFSTGFHMNDSIFQFEKTQVVKAKLISADDRYVGLYTVNFPSRDAKAAAKTTRADGDDSGIWQFNVYVKMNGKWVENKLAIKDPLQAGKVKIIKLKMLNNGSLVSETPQVGVSVTLDWKNASEYDVEI